MLDRKTPPPFIHSTSFDLIKPERKTLSNGVDVFLVRGGNQDVIKVECIFKAGRWFETQLGAAYFCGHLLNKGSKTKSSFEIAQIFDQYGAHLEIQPGLDFISVALYGLTKYLTPALDLLIEILTVPEFPAKEVDQHKSIFIQNLKVNEEKTSYLASKGFRKRLFGDTHPYGTELEEGSVNKITRDVIRSHFSNFFQSFSVFVSGKVDDISEATIANKFAIISTGTQHARSVDIKPQPAFHTHIEKEGSVQCSIRAGKRSLMRSHPDYAQAIFVSHILGGYFGSRLMKNIREEKGLTYGIYASIHPLFNDSYFVIGADVNRENLSLTMDEIRKELKILRTERITDDELDTAKNHFIGSLQSEITTSFAHADKIKTIFLNKLPQNFYQQLIHTIDAITAEEIIRISETHFHEDSCSEVSVG
jgi:zinc protease